jgi:hypothetical protein
MDRRLAIPEQGMLHVLPMRTISATECQELTVILGSATSLRMTNRFRPPRFAW